MVKICAIAHLMTFYGMIFITVIMIVGIDIIIIIHIWNNTYGSDNCNNCSNGDYHPYCYYNCDKDNISNYS